MEQKYPKLEYIIIDGGSTDNSVELIRKYEKHLKYWVSEKDRGQSHAINKGFEHATGDLFGWLNSDDYYTTGSLQAVAEMYINNPDAGAIVGAGEYVDANGTIYNCSSPKEVSSETLYCWFDKFFWQPSCFFKKYVWEQCGPLDEKLQLAMDLDLWLKIAKKYAFATTEKLLSINIKHPEAKTTIQSHLSDIEAIKLILKHGGAEAVPHVLNSYATRLLNFDCHVRNQLEEKDRQLVEWAWQLMERDRQLMERDRQIASMKHHLARVETQLADQQNVIQSLLSSLSWKVTAPLRKVLDTVYRLRSGLMPLAQHELLAQPPLPLKFYYGNINVRFAIPVSADPLVSIIIPVHNQWDYTQSCLYSITENVLDIEYEVIVADDASDDETANVSDHVPNVIVHRNERNIGFLLNCNAAARIARGKYIVFLNNDTNVQQDWLRHLLSQMESDSTIGLVGSKLVYPDGKLQEAGGIVWYDASAMNYGRMDDPQKPEYQYVKDVDYVSGASMMIRRDLWERIGGFDPRFAPAYYEDTDLAFSVRKAGYRVVYQPESLVVHFEGISHGTDISQGIKQNQVKNRELFRQKWADVLVNGHGTGISDLFWARDRSRDKKTVVFIDYEVPHFDMFAGSRTNFMYLKLLVSMGYNVKFIGADFRRCDQYTAALNRVGIETLDGDWYKENWGQWFTEHTGRIDYVFFNKPDPTLVFIDYVRENTRAKIIYQMHDLHYLRLQRRFELEKDDSVLQEAKKYKQMEHEIFVNSDVILTFSNVEREIVAKDFPYKHVVTVPLFFYDNVPAGQADFNSRKGIMFVGGFGHAPNVDAVTWFAANVFPKILTVVPDLNFYVVGAAPPPEILRLASESIKICGQVSEDELEQLYQQIRMIVVPLRFGAGVKGKTIEAMQRGIPLVSTSIGIEGIQGIDVFLRPKDSDVDFADEVISLYSDVNKWCDISKESLRYIRSNFSTEKAATVLSTFLN